MEAGIHAASNPNLFVLEIPQPEGGTTTPENPISRELVSVTQRLIITARLFDIQFSLVLEPTIFATTGSLAKAYHGGYWDFFSLSNGGFYMAPDLHARFSIVCDNGFEGRLSADALVIPPDNHRPQK